MQKMNVGERLITISILPRNGSFITMKVVQGIIGKLSMTSADIISYDICESDGNVRWNEKGKEKKEFDLEPVELALIKKSLQELDSNGGLTQENLPVYELFMGV